MILVWPSLRTARRWRDFVSINISVTTIPSQTRPRRAATVRHPALTDTNRERLQVGVGEKVDVYFDPPLGMSFPEEPFWWTSAGSLEGKLSPTLLGLSGSAVKFTAPSNAATANVRASFAILL